MAVLEEDCALGTIAPAESIPDPINPYMSPIHDTEEEKVWVLDPWPNLLGCTIIAGSPRGLGEDHLLVRRRGLCT